MDERPRPAGADGLPPTQGEAEMARFKQLLAEQLTRCEQMERNRIAQLLHDDLQQHLVAAQIRVSLLQNADSRDMAIQALRAILAQAIRLTHTLVSDLSPPVLHGVGLVDAMRWLGERAAEQGLTVDVDGAECDAALGEERSILVFHAVRELLLNVAKHARTSRVSVVVRRQSDRVEITVADQGVGFDPGAQRRDARGPGGFGLANLRERLNCMGGEIQIDSAPGRGTRATVALRLTP